MVGLVLLDLNERRGAPTAGPWGREGEMAIRRALGAGRGRMARELLVDSLALALLAGIAGLFLGQGLSRSLVASLKVPVTPPVARWVRYDKLVPLSQLTHQANTVPEGLGPRQGEAGPSIDYNFVGRGYFG